MAKQRFRDTAGGGGLQTAPDAVDKTETGHDKIAGSFGHCLIAATTLPSYFAFMSDGFEHVAESNSTGEATNVDTGFLLTPPPHVPGRSLQTMITTNIRFFSPSSDPSLCPKSGRYWSSIIAISLTLEYT